LFHYNARVGETSTETAMKKIISIALLALLSFVALPSYSFAQDITANHHFYEYAIVKWDGRIACITTSRMTNSNWCIWKKKA
jgi:hypothetical protein